MDGFTLEDVRRVVREELAAAATPEWLDSTRAAEYLGTTRATLHNLVSAGRLPRHGEPGTALRFRRTDLDAYVAGRRS